MIKLYYHSKIRQFTKRSSDINYVYDDDPVGNELVYSQYATKRVVTASNTKRRVPITKKNQTR